MNNLEMAELKRLLLEAPDSQLDPAILPLIAKWSDPPKSLEVLETVDMCIYWGAASEFTVGALQIILDFTLQEEGKTLEDIVPLAFWRNTL